MGCGNPLRTHMQVRRAARFEESIQPGHWARIALWPPSPIGEGLGVGPLSGSPLRAGEGLGVRFLCERLPEALAARHLAQRLALLLARADLLRRIAKRHDRQQVYALRDAEHRLDGGRIASAHPVAADPARPRRQ